MSWKTCLFLLLITTRVVAQKVPDENDPKKHPTAVNTMFVDELAGKPISFYLNHPRIGKFEKLFYKGEWAIYDDDYTFAFLDSVMTQNPETRPFYFYIFCRVRERADGAMGEYISVKCHNYISEYPCEFFQNVKKKEYGTDAESWASMISFDLHDAENYMEFASRLDHNIKNSCPKNQFAWNNLKSSIYKYLDEK